MVELVCIPPSPVVESCIHHCHVHQPGLNVNLRPDIFVSYFWDYFAITTHPHLPSSKKVEILLTLVWVRGRVIRGKSQGWCMKCTLIAYFRRDQSFSVFWNFETRNIRTQKSESKTKICSVIYVKLASISLIQNTYLSYLKSISFCNFECWLNYFIFSLICILIS